MRRDPWKALVAGVRARVGTGARVRARVGTGKELTTSCRQLFRALLAGGAATLADLGVMALLVSLVGLDARIANMPALVAGGVVNFLGNRHFAFRAAEGSLARQAALYTIVEILALVLNGVLFDLAMRILVATHVQGATSWAYVPVRLVTSHLVFSCWSYPLWCRVFRLPRKAEAV